MATTSKRAIVGIDTASNRLHWVSSIPLGSAGTYGWHVCKDENPDVRRTQLFRYACQMFQSIPEGSHVWCEEPLALQNGNTTRLLALAAGAIWAAFIQEDADAYWHWVDQSSWKKEVLGRGIRPKDFVYKVKKNAEKEWIQQGVSMLPGFQRHVLNSHVVFEDFDKQRDLYDAYAIKVYGARAVHGGMVSSRGED